MGNTKDITEKLKNGKTGKNDRKNVQKLLILVLKYTWHYEKDLKIFLYVCNYFSMFVGSGNVKIKVSKKANLAN